MHELDARRRVGADGAVRRLSAALGDTFTIAGPLAGGETGATAVDSGDGRRFVLKWATDPGTGLRRAEGVVLAERLRVDAGWPAPEQQALDVDGCLLVLQAFMPGSAVTHLSPSSTRCLFCTTAAWASPGRTSGTPRRTARYRAEPRVASAQRSVTSHFATQRSM